MYLVLLLIPVAVYGVYFLMGKQKPRAGESDEAFQNRIKKVRKTILICFWILLVLTIAKIALEVHSDESLKEESQNTMDLQSETILELN